MDLGDESAMLSAVELEDVILDATEELALMYMGEELDINLDLDHIKERVASAVPLASRKGLPPWYRHMSYPVTPAEAVLSV